MKKMLIVPVMLLSLGGCSSEVDKCVAEWEKANPGPDDEGGYCTASQKIDGKCMKDYDLTKAQARASIRSRCLEAAGGNR